MKRSKTTAVGRFRSEVKGHKKQRREKARREVIYVSQEIERLKKNSLIWTKGEEKQSDMVSRFKIEVRGHKKQRRGRTGRGVSSVSRKKGRQRRGAFFIGAPEWEGAEGD